MYCVYYNVQIRCYMYLCLWNVEIFWYFYSEFQKSVLYLLTEIRDRISEVGKTEPPDSLFHVDRVETVADFSKPRRLLKGQGYIPVTGMCTCTAKLNYFHFTKCQNIQYLWNHMNLWLMWISIFTAKLNDWLYQSFTAHQHQKGHTVPNQMSLLDDVH